MRALQQALGEDELETTRRGASRVGVALAFFIDTPLRIFSHEPHGRHSSIHTYQSYHTDGIAPSTYMSQCVT